MLLIAIGDTDAEPGTTGRYLTPAEHHIVCLASRGFSSARIALERGSSRRTVETQLGSVYRKLGIGSRCELVQFRARLAITEAKEVQGSRVSRLGDTSLLSQRQHQVALLAQRGCGDKEIGYTLGISRSTVAGHLTSAMHKLGVHSRIELGTLAI